MFKRILAGIASSVLPLVASAQTVNTSYNGNTGIGGLLTWFSGLLTLAVPLIISLAVVWFLVTIFQYVVAGNEEAKAKAKTHIIWGIVGLFIMVSVWGLVRVISSTFQLNNNVQQGPIIPSLQG